jgi:hypothetical protein
VFQSSKLSASPGQVTIREFKPGDEVAFANSTKNGLRATSASKGKTSRF